MEFFRSMTPAEDQLPRLGDSARHLGIRVGTDISPDPQGYVHPGTGGLSVAPGSPWKLPPHRRPKTLGRASTGPSGDVIYSIASVRIEAQQLQTRADADDHALVEPATTVSLSEYVQAIQQTRPDWKRWIEEPA